jgi:hypothetical protein
LKRALLSLCLAALWLLPAQAHDIYELRKSLSIPDFTYAGQTESLCSDVFRHELIRSRRYDVIPLWYVQRQVPEPPGEDWMRLLSQTSSDLVALGLVQIQGNQQLSVSVLVAQRDPEPSILFADAVTGPGSELPMMCQQLAERFLGERVELPVRSPALAGTLSLIFPGAGHFYTGKPLNALLGAAFLGAYIGIAALGFNSTDNSTVTRAQWGGVLLLVSLTDILTAYFLSQDSVERSP